MRILPFFRVSLGLNTKVDPVRLQYDPESGAQFLAEAVNVDIDPTGRISRRQGLREIAEVTDPHSIWATKDQTAGFVIVGDSLYSLTVAGTMSAIKDGLTVGAAGHFCEVGQDVYFSNGTDIGIIRNRQTWEEWEETPYTGPETDRNFTGPSAGTHLFVFRGRLFYATSNFLIYSEPFNYGCFDPARNFLPIPGGSILMTHPIENGFFVSSDKGVYFIDGPVPSEFGFKHALPYPVVPGTTAVSVYAEQVMDGVQGEAVLFMAQYAGLCIGLGDGTVIRLMESRMDMPPASAGCAVLNAANNMQYITFLEV